MRLRTPLYLLPALLLALTLGATAPARGALVLSFNQPTFSTVPNGTVNVQVLLSQVGGGAQVTPSNPLLTAGITLTYNPSLVAVQTITGGPGWGVDTATPGTGTAVLALSSFAGQTIPGGGLVLGTFTLRGLAFGLSPLVVASLSPGPSFVTLNGDFLDPTLPATASLAVVPEPSSALLVGVGAAGLLALGRRRRRA
jgi:hypothetical protein